MSFTVHKFPLPAGLPSVTNLSVPGFVKTLSVHEQHGKVCLWCYIDDTDLFSRDLTVERLVTGGIAQGPAKNILNYVGTVLMDHGHFVTHIFVEAAR